MIARTWDFRRMHGWLNSRNFDVDRITGPKLLKVVKVLFYCHWRRERLSLSQPATPPVMITWSPWGHFRLIDGWLDPSVDIAPSICASNGVNVPVLSDFQTPGPTWQRDQWSKTVIILPRFGLRRQLLNGAELQRPKPHRSFWTLWPSY